MKRFFTFLALLLAGFSASAQQKQASDSLQTQVVEASCGQCKFGLKGKGCNLAVRIDGKAYFVDGSDIDGHGDAHAKDGFCNAIRKAVVKGKVVDNRFKATSFVLVKEKNQ